jgi:hypothetical protein
VKKSPDATATARAENRRPVRDPLLEIRRLAALGEPAARAILAAEKDPEPLSPEDQAALDAADARFAAGGPTFTHEQVLGMIEARRRAEGG